MRDLALSGAANGIEASAYNSQHGIVVRDVTSTPTAPGGSGASFGGNATNIDGFTTSYRSTGLSVGNGTGLTLRDITTSKSSFSGVSVSNVVATTSAPFVFEDIDVRGGQEHGIRFDGVNATDVPITLSPATQIVLQDNAMSVRFSNTRYVTVEDLAIRN